MNFSTKVVGDKHELRFWTPGRNGYQSRRRFNSPKELIAFRNCISKLAAFGEQYARRFADGEDFESILYEIKNPRLVNGEIQRTFGEELEFWKLNKLCSFAPGWKSNVLGYEKEFEALKDFKIHEINKELVTEIQSQLRARGNSQRTINYKIGWLQGILNYSYKMDRIERNPIANFQKSKPVEHERGYWQLHELQSFLEFVNLKYPQGSEHRFIYAAYLTALNTAVRAGELWAMRPSCRQRNSNLIRIMEQYNLRAKEFLATKGKRGRNVPQSAELRLELESLEKHRKLRGGDLYFSYDGQPMSHYHFEGIFLRDQQEWGGPKIVFHGLRHTAATQMLRAGVQIHDLQKILGHKDINTTMKYLHMIDSEVERAADVYGVGAKAHLRVVS